MFIMMEKIGNIKKAIESIKENQMEMLELKNTISEQKTTPHWLSRRRG